ncbi:MAG: SDR family oxidoreductase [Congregibacter sp.]
MQRVKTALITGASAGIGESYVRKLAAGCERIRVVARRAERLEKLAKELASQCEIVPIIADLSTTEGQAAVVESIRQQPAPDVLINNAGFSTLGHFASSELDKEFEMLRLHQEATLALTRAALPAMLERGSGAIINVSSIGGFADMPGVATYGASKAFLVSFSRSLRSELVDSGVHVQCLCPGYTRTEIHSRESFVGFDVSRVPDEMWMEADAVVDESLNALGDCLSKQGKRWLVITGEQNRQLVQKALKQLADEV